jgi:hypothetical protein
MAAPGRSAAAEARRFLVWCGSTVVAVLGAVASLQGIGWWPSSPEFIPALPSNTSYAEPSFQVKNPSGVFGMSNTELFCGFHIDRRARLPNALVGGPEFEADEGDQPPIEVGAVNAGQTGDAHCMWRPEPQLQSNVPLDANITAVRIRLRYDVSPWPWHWRRETAPEIYTWGLNPPRWTRNDQAGTRFKFCNGDRPSDPGCIPPM